MRNYLANGPGVNPAHCQCKSVTAMAILVPSTDTRKFLEMAKTVMVVDDSGSFRTVVKLALQKAGYGVVEAIDGQDACDKLDGRPLSLIVCDVNMPRMDGLALLKHLKTQDQYKSTPVIMLTAESQESKKAAGRIAGARAWITKPFQPLQLLDAVNRLCA